MPCVHLISPLDWFSRFLISSLKYQTDFSKSSLPRLNPMWRDCNTFYATWMAGIVFWVLYVVVFSMLNFHFVPHFYAF